MTPPPPPVLEVSPNPLSITQLGLRNKSSFRPPHGLHAVETFIDFINKSFHDLRDDIEKGRLHFPPNLSAVENQPLRTLQEDGSLIIKPADKGGALVVMDKSLYLSEIIRQLQNESIYSKLTRDPVSDILAKIEFILKKYSTMGILDSKTIEFLTKRNPITPVVAGLRDALLKQTLQERLRANPRMSFLEVGAEARARESKQEQGMAAFDGEGLERGDARSART
ncbi:unnamed protein product [Ranitomeya imitator]|uniref:Uncharacterized protein n=1 Tax=Ranitomeya imitator TaxID=111125 RepID=A0ABN9LCC7_9NEOB|nr:unnamed protein product [Ranitomeya imitator]